MRTSPSRSSSGPRSGRPEGSKGERRAAWRDLVRARGAGRAAWIVRHYAPAGRRARQERPFEPAAGDRRDRSCPRPPNRSALADYWTAVWKADGAAGAIGEAAAGLTQALGLSPADAVRARRPLHARQSFGPSSPPATRADCRRSTLRGSPCPSPGNPRAASWTSPAQVTILPDRFVILGYQGDQLVLEAEGTPIPSPLIVGPDPSAPPEDQLRHAADGSLEVPEDMRWMTDFDRAVEVGMGIRIPLDSEPVRCLAADLARWSRLASVRARIPTKGASVSSSC